MRLCDESKPYIFISYSHRDTDQVIDIIKRLKDEGYNVWYDEGIDPGTEWDENIAYHVNGCEYFIAFISAGYVGSKNCKDELNYSRDLDKNQLLVYLEDVELPIGMAMRMNRIQSIFWNKYAADDIEKAYDKLFSAQGIDKTKVFKKEIPEKKEEKVEEKAVVNEPVPAPVVQETIGLDVLLKRGKIAVSDGEWDKAEDFFERALNIDPESSEAYLGKFLIEKKMVSVAELIKHLVNKQPKVEGEKAVACGADEEHIAKIVKENVIEGYLSEAEIRKAYDGFDFNYEKTAKGVVRNSKAIIDELTENKNYNHAKQFITDGDKEEMQLLQNIIEAQERLINSADDNDEAKKKNVIDSYSDFLKEADKKVEEMKLAAEKKQADDITKKEQEEEEKKIAKAKEIEDAVAEGNKLLSENDFLNATVLFKKATTLDSKRADAYFGMFLAANKSNDAKSLVDYYIKKFEEVKEEKAEACPVDMDRIDAGKEKYKLGNVITEAKILASYEFDRTYISKMAACEKQKIQFETEIENSPSLKSAIENADDKLKAEIDSFISEVNKTLDKKIADAKKNEEDEINRISSEYKKHLDEADKALQELYNNSLEDQDKAYNEVIAKADEVFAKDKETLTMDELEGVLASLEPMAGYKDADKYIATCQEKLEPFKAEIEAAKDAAKKANNKKAGIIGIAVAVVAVIGILVFFIVINPMIKYNKAIEYNEHKQYDAAIALFTELGDYKNSKALLAETRKVKLYEQANTEFAAGKFADAEAHFKELGSYKDAANGVIICKYCRAKELLENKNYDEANALFTEISSYEDSKDLAKEALYRKANELAAAGKDKDAIAVYQSITSYKDSMTKINDLKNGAKYNEAVNYLNNLEYDKAKKAFDELKGYKDSNEKSVYCAKKILSKAKVGDTVTYGNIDWIVLKKENNSQMWLISKKSVGKQVYSKTGEAKWESSDLRQWLNGAFCNNFTSDEKNNMLSFTTYQIIHDGDESIKTTDKVIALSYDNVRDCFDNQNVDNSLIDIGSAWWVLPNKSRRTEGTPVLITKREINEEGRGVISITNLENAPDKLKDKCDVRPVIAVKY